MFSFYDLSRLLPDIMTPLSFSMACLTTALIVRKRFWSNLFLSASLLTLLVFSSPLTSQWLIRTLENRYPALPIEQVPASDVAILLGGALNLPVEGLTRAELGSSGDRILLAAELYLAGKVNHILISSGSYETKLGFVSEAEHTSLLLQRFGIPSKSILLEHESGNTYENAIKSASKLESLGFSDAKYILVTSAFHLPRARALFCHAGLDTLGISANHWANPASRITKGNWFFQAKALAGSTRVLREYLGITAYGVAGRLSFSMLSHEKSCAS